MFWRREDSPVDYLPNPDEVSAVEVPEKFFLEKWQSVQLKCPSVQAQKAWRKVAVSTDGVPFSGPGKFWGKWQLREGFAENGS